MLAFMSCSGSPGVTTTALGCTYAIAAYSSAREVAFVECAAAGGVVGPRYGMSTDRGLTSLTIDVGESQDLPDVSEHAQPLPGVDLPVVLAPPSAKVVSKLLTSRGEAFASYLASLPIRTVVDCGRVHPGIGTVIAASAVLTCVVVNPVREELYLAAAAMRDISEHEPVRFAVMVRGDSPYRIEEIEDLLEHEVIAEVPDDPKTAAVLNGTSSKWNKIENGPLIQALKPFAEEWTATTERSHRYENEEPALESQDTPKTAPPIPNSANLLSGPPIPIDALPTVGDVR